MAEVKKSKTRTLQLAICWFVFAVIVAFWVAAVLLAQQDHARTLAQVDESNAGLVRVLAEHAERTLDYADSLALQVKRDFEERGERTDLRRMATDVKVNRELVIGVIVTNARGDVLQTIAAQVTRANLADREHFQVHVAADSGKPFISKPISARTLQGRPTIALSRRLNRADGSFNGMVAVAVDPAAFTGVYSQLKLGEKGQIILTGLDGFNRARNGAGAAEVGQDVRQGALYKIYSASESGVARYTARIDGVTRFAAYRRLQKYPLVIAVGVAEKSVLAEVEARARYLFLGAAAATLLALLAAAALLYLVRRRDRDAALVAESELRYRRLVDDSPDATLVWRDGKILYANGALVALIGAQGINEIVGQSFFRFVEPASQQELRDAIADVGSLCGADSARRLELRFVRFDGSLIDVENSGINIILPDGPARHVVVRDITRRKEIEVALRVNEERYRMLVDSSPDAIIIYTDEQLSFVNPAAVSLLGAQSADQLIGRGLTQLIHPSGQAAALARRAYVVKTAQSTGLWEQTFMRVDGTPILVEGNTISLPGTQNRQRLISVRDIGPRKRAEAALRESETRLRTAFDAVAMSNWEWDIASDQTHWGYGYEKILGALPEGALKYPDFRGMVHANDRVRYLAAGRATMQHDAPYDVEFRFIRTDGVERWMRSSGRAVRDVEGRIEAMAGVTQDVTQRHEVELELAASQRRSDALMESIPAPAWLKDRDGRFIAVNRAWNTRFGYEPGYAIGRTNRDLFDKALALERDREDEQVIASGEEVRVEHRSRLERGKAGWFETIKSPVFDENGVVSGTVGVSYDTSARRQMEEELRVSEERFRQYAEAVEDVFWISEFEPYRVVYVNSAFRKIWGLEPEALYANPWQWNECIHADDRADVRRVFEAWINNPAADSYHAEYRIVRADGATRWIKDYGSKLRDAGGKTYRLQGIAEDITERRASEIALAESHRRRDALLEANPDPAWLKDLQGHYIAVNRAWIARRGLAPQEVEGKRDEDFFTPEQAAIINADDRRVIETGAVVRSERNWNHADGTKWIEVVKAPVLDSAGKVTAIVGLSHDISERKRVETAVQTMNTTLEQKTAELMALNRELEAFAYTVSHDLRAPLRHIDGFVILLKKHAGPKFDAQSTRYFERISKAAHRMGQLIDDLLAFSRTGRAALRMQRVPLARLVRQTIEHLQPDLAARKFEWNIGDLPIVRGDAGLLAIVAQNLIANAIKYTRPRQIAKIEISATQSADGMTELSVRDNGVGFDMQFSNKLFGVFQRLHTEAEFEGTGIGLATVARIVHRHGGQVRAEGAPDGGACFYVTLPGVAADDGA